ncbi:hypothetical protein N5079_19770 [Planotetraspora sp. A-T 1434]|uniref:hypothetical protein n=1 Tax=Planotetraspora sp. A-T 1434 TaxID=2979219 RepID=UPI0021BFB521|nr:hypothetical protein [Planotetraspora sp. A-T 1434]MCT9932443.1 hypothetical protein [Planotetraspora sp. A-T 1434]
MSWALLDSGVAGFADGGSGHPYTFPGGAPPNGSLLALAVTSDTTVNPPPGWSIAVSDVGNIGAYIFYKVAASEGVSVTVTTNGNANTEIGYLSYSGGRTSSPLDVTVAARSTVSNTTTPAATTGALAEAGELSIAAACLGGLQGQNQLSPVWSSGYTGRLDGQTAGNAATDQHLFVADRYDAGTAAESPNVAWTHSTNNQTLLVATFRPAAGGGVVVVAPRLISQYGGYF